MLLPHLSAEGLLSRSSNDGAVKRHPKVERRLEKMNNMCYLHYKLFGYNQTSSLVMQEVYPVLTYGGGEGNKCGLCCSTEDIEVHHVRKLADIRKKYKGANILRKQENDGYLSGMSSQDSY